MVVEQSGSDRNAVSGRTNDLNKMSDSLPPAGRERTPKGQSGGDRSVADRRTNDLKIR